MENMRNILRRIRSIFQGQGINYDTKIVEYLSFLLLIYVQGKDRELIDIESNRHRLSNFEEQISQKIDQIAKELRNIFQEYNKTLPTSPPKHIPSNLLFEIIYLIGEALKQCSPKVFFQCFIRFELLKNTKGGQYPTPHHIAKTMATLLELQAENKIIDPACGSGGLLAAVAENILRGNIESIEINGYDFDQSWATMGWCNLAFHEKPSEIFVKSAFSLLPDFKEKYDYVLLNPPFGGIRSKGEIYHTIGLQYGTKNETVFTALSLELLKPKGRCAILVPTGLLFGRGGEQRLRTRLLNQNLEAIVALPEHAFQPYNQTSTNLLLFQKKRSDDTSQRPVWLFQLNSDGYEPGTSRDLTKAPDPNTNELPLMVEAVLSIRSQSIDLTIKDLKQNKLAYVKALNPADGRKGVSVVVGSADENRQLEAILLDNKFLFVIRDNAEKVLCWSTISPTGDDSIRAGVFDATETFEWSSLSSTNIVMEAMPKELLVGDRLEESDAMCEFHEDLNEFIFHAGKKKSIFKLTPIAQPPSEAETIIGLIVDEHGEALAPFLSVRDEKDNPLDELNIDLLEPFSPRRIYDVETDTVGALITLSAESEDQSSETVTEMFYFIIVKNQAVELFRTQTNGGDDNGFVALCQGGFLKVFAENKCIKLAINIGTNVFFKKDTQPEGITITDEGIVIGLLVDKSQLGDVSEEDPNQYNAKSFEPREFFEEPILEFHDPPGEILAKIRKNQSIFSEKIDSLLGMIAGSKGHGEVFPPKKIEPFSMVNALNSTQRRLWELISELELDGTPCHFDADQLWDIIQEEKFQDSVSSIGMVVQYLNLFEKMGLIQQVVVGEKTYYRILTTSDIFVLEDG